MAAHVPATDIESRYQMFRDTFLCALGTALSGAPAEAFDSQFPTLSKDQKAAVQEVYRQALRLTRVNCEAQFADIVDQHQLPQQLAALEELCSARGIDGFGGLTSRAAAAKEQPHAVAGSLRIKAKQAEKAVLIKQLAEIEQRQSEAEAHLRNKAQQVVDTASQYRAISQQLVPLHTAATLQFNSRSIDVI